MISRITWSPVGRGSWSTQSGSDRLAVRTLRSLRMEISAAILAELTALSDESTDPAFDLPGLVQGLQDALLAGVPSGLGVSITSTIGVGVPAVTVTTLEGTATVGSSLWVPLPSPCRGRQRGGVLRRDPRRVGGPRGRPAVGAAPAGRGVAAGPAPDTPLRCGPHRRPAGNVGHSPGVGCAARAGPHTGSGRCGPADQRRPVRHLGAHRRRQSHPRTGRPVHPNRRHHRRPGS